MIRLLNCRPATRRQEPLVQHLKWLVVLAVVACPDLAVAQEIGDGGQPPSAPRQPPEQRVRAAFPDSAQVDLQLPEPIGTTDVEYFAWISGADAKSAGIVRDWAAMMSSIGGEWRSGLLEKLKQPASDYVALLEVNQSFGERASRLKQLVTWRDRLVDELFAQERRFLESLLSSSSVDGAEAETVVEQVMMVRRAEAFPADNAYAPHLAANILRLLHLSATDPGTSPEASATIRRLALDNAPRVCEQRRIVFDAIAKCSYRGNEALQRAIDSGSPTVGAMKGVFRPIALGSARVAATTQELVAIARAELSPEVANKLDQGVLRLTYGALAIDIFELDAIVKVIDHLLPDQDRETCATVIVESARQRAALREQLLRSFDLQRSRFVERGLVRDQIANDQFRRTFLGYVKAAKIAAEQTIGKIAAIARANSKWDEAEFGRAQQEWRSTARERLRAMSITGATSPILSYSQLEAIAQEALEQ